MPNGLVLAGGRSTRMGSDKGLINYHGTPQRDHLFHLLQEVCETVYTSCRKDHDIPEGNNPLIDLFEIPGPLNGILSAFSHAPDAGWLIVAVDMPYVNKQTLELLLSKRDRSKVATCFYNTDRKECEPLLTLWEPLAFPQLQEFVAKGNLSPRKFLMTHGANMIQIPDLNVLTTSTPRQKRAESLDQ